MDFVFSRYPRSELLMLRERIDSALSSLPDCNVFKLTISVSGDCVSEALPLYCKLSADSED